MSHLEISYMNSVDTWPTYETGLGYGVAAISWLLKIIGLFGKRALLKRRYSAKETYNLKYMII